MTADFVRSRRRSRRCENAGKYGLFCTFPQGCRLCRLHRGVLGKLFFSLFLWVQIYFPHLRNEVGKVGGCAKSAQIPCVFRGFLRADFGADFCRLCAKSAVSGRAAKAKWKKPADGTHRRPATDGVGWRLDRVGNSGNRSFGPQLRQPGKPHGSSWSRVATSNRISASVFSFDRLAARQGWLDD